jgi:serine/threonine protein phosphatase 1
MTLQTYAIGDVHGYLDQLLRAHDLIEADRAANGSREAPVVHLGDYVDRGPDARGVLDFLAGGLADQRNWVVLKGNHDRMFTGFLDDADFHDPGLRPDLHWFDPRLGGVATLAAYGVPAADRMIHDVHADATAAVPAAHRRVIAGLPTSFLRGAALFVHAGIRPGVDLHDQTETDLVWIRKGFLEDQRDHGVLVVHGHTALNHPAHYGNRLNIDGGAGYGRPLVPVVVEGRDAWALAPSGRVAIPRGTV